MNGIYGCGCKEVYVTVHVERDHKSAILILRYGGVRQTQRILSFSIFSLRECGRLYRV